MAFFNREKIVNGLLRSCEKRPVSLDQIEQIVSEIERDLQGGIEKEVSSLRIGEMILKRLRQLDEVAYVRFASVYRQFRDVSEFSEEVQNLLQRDTRSS